MTTFGFKKAVMYIADGEEVIMVSEDFKTHSFRKDKNNTNNIIHEIIGGNNRVFTKNTTIDDMKSKYSENKFYLR